MVEGSQCFRDRLCQLLPVIKPELETDEAAVETKIVYWNHKLPL
jgi:hypothetical protein